MNGSGRTMKDSGWTRRGSGQVHSDVPALLAVWAGVSNHPKGRVVVARRPAKTAPGESASCYWKTLTERSATNQQAAIGKP